MKTKTTLPAGLNVRFKAIPAGQHFTHDGQRFRKATARAAYRIKPNGIGETHAALPFARNSWVTV